MKKLIILSGLLLLSVCGFSQVDTIQNNENGLSVRRKINQTILNTNSLMGSTPGQDSSFQTVFTDNVSELTTDNGVVIDGTKFKDYYIFPHNSYPGQNITADADELSFEAGASEVLDMKASGVTTQVPFLFGTSGVDVGSSGQPGDEFYFNFWRLYEQSTPSAPSANTGIIWMSSSDEHIYFRNSTETFDLTEGTGGGGADPDSIFDEVTANDTLRVGAYGKAYLNGTSLVLEDGTDTVEIGDMSAAVTFLNESLPLDTLVRTKGETRKVFGFSVGFGEVVDTSIATTSGSYIISMSIPDSTVMTKITVWADSTGLGLVPNFYIQGNFKAGGDLSSAGTNFFTSAEAVAGSQPVTTGEEFTSFSSTGYILPPGKILIEFVISGMVNEFTRLIVLGEGYYKNDD